MYTLNTLHLHNTNKMHIQLTNMYRGADKSLARPGRKQSTATQDFEFHVSCL